MASVAAPPRRRLLLLLVGLALLSLLLLSLPLGRHGPRLPSDVGLALEAVCVREVLAAVRLPRSRLVYSLEPLAAPLPLSRLGPRCRGFLTPRPVSAQRRAELACFLPEPWLRQFDAADNARMRAGIGLLAQAFRRAGVTVLLDAGSALGSWRMHGRIPYDTDLDLGVLKPQQSRAIAALAGLARRHPDRFRHYWHGRSFWRMDLLRPGGGRLLQVDVFVHAVTGKPPIVRQAMPPHEIHARYLLPPVRRPFEGALFPTYRNPPLYIWQMYGWGAMQECRPTPWVVVHFGLTCPVRTVNCSELDFFYNFVRRLTHVDGSAVEVLFNRTHALSVFYSPEG